MKKGLEVLTPASTISGRSAVSGCWRGVSPQPGWSSCGDGDVQTQSLQTNTAGYMPSLSLPVLTSAHLSAPNPHQ